MAEAPGGARTPRSDPGSGPPSERNRLLPAGGAPTTPPGRAGGQKSGRIEMLLRTFRLGHEGQSFLRNRRQKGEGFCRNGPGPLPTDRGPASAGACADDPVRLPSLTLCSDSKVVLHLAGSCWASFSP
jgi:hypothetical protein